jgi:alpha-glucosidase (family GH31 glycosyl hydrolase)
MNIESTLFRPCWFVIIECPSFTLGVNSLFFVHDQKLKSQITWWWQGVNSGIVDFTNPAAVVWWRSRLQRLVTEYGIDSFKFDAGETNWLPYASQLIGNANLQPNLYTTRYVEAVSAFGGLIEVRAARRNQVRVVSIE